MSPRVYQEFLELCDMEVVQRLRSVPYYESIVVPSGDMVISDLRFRPLPETGICYFLSDNEYWDDFRPAELVV